MSALSFDANGLIPVIVQDRVTGEIRMFAFASPEAIRATLESGRATFWSRSRGELWEKGRTSNNPIFVKRILVDCDFDCLIYSAEPQGPSCHTGAENCFFQVLGPSLEASPRAEEPQSILRTLEAVLEARKESSAQSSYTKSLYEGGAAAITAKLHEEVGELAAAVEREDDERVAAEAADVLYHMLVALRWRGLSWRDVLIELSSRMGKSGLEEKAARGGEGRPRS